MNTLEQLVAKMTAEQYQQVKTAIELGKWPDGNRLTEEHKDMLYQAIIAYEVKHDIAEEQRTGFLDRGNSQCAKVSSQPASSLPYEL